MLEYSYQKQIDRQAGRQADRQNISISSAEQEKKGTYTNSITISLTTLSQFVVIFIFTILIFNKENTEFFSSCRQNEAFALRLGRGDPLLSHEIIAGIYYLCRKFVSVK